MKTAIIILSFFIYTVSAADPAQSDTLKLWDAYCEASNPYAIDTTIFKYGNDTLYIRNIHNGICYADNYRAIAQFQNDTLKIKIVNIAGGIDCMGDCSKGYTIKIPMASFDTLNVKIENEYFTIKESDIQMSTQQEISEGIMIYPNPVQNSLRIFGNGISKIEILDLNGNIQLKESESFNCIDLSGLKAGVYIVLITTNNNSLARKIIKK
jgi:hypothetical protein